MQKSIFLLLACTLLSAHSLRAITYYVSATGNDANTGRSPSAAWRSIGKVNSTMNNFVAGDSVLFRRGDVFRGEIVLNQPNTSARALAIGAYGTGSRPVISGSVAVNGWTLHAGNIWVANVAQTVRNVLVGSRPMTLARFPNTGWLTADRINSSSSFYDAALTQPSGYWAGATVRLRSKLWLFENRTIGSYSGGTISFGEGLRWGFEQGWGYYLENKLEQLDSPGEWFYDSASKKLYFWAPNNANPNNLAVEASVMETGLRTSPGWWWFNYTIADLQFENQYRVGVLFNGGMSGCTIRNCVFYRQMSEGIVADCSDGQGNNLIENNLIEDVWGTGISGYGTHTIRNNTVRRIGLRLAYNGRDEVCTGIWTKGPNGLIQNNVLDSIGYNGIGVYGSNNLIERNIVSNVMLTHDEGGALYAFGANARGNTWRANIVSNVRSNREMVSTSLNWSPQMGAGIMMDNAVPANVIENNVVNTVSEHGIFIQFDCKDIVIRGNTIYNPRTTGINLLTDDAQYSDIYPNHTLESNTLVSLNPSAYTLHMDYMHGLPGTFGGTNYYFHPYDATSVRHAGYQNGNWQDNAFTVPQWKTFSGQDANAKGSFVNLTFTNLQEALNRFPIFVNDGPTARTFPLNGTYKNLDNQDVIGSITVPAYSARVLVWTGNAAPPSSTQAVTSLTLINADTDQEIATLTNGYVINFAQTGTRNLSIRANTNPATVGSVTFNLNGTVIRTESGVPYAINGDQNNGTDYTAWTPALGNHTLVCTPFTAFGGTGTAGQALSISFSVIDRANQPPSVSAGANRSLTLPTNNITLNGTATDADGSIASLAWTQRSGPNTATLSGANTPNLAASNLVAGSYVFRLTATDNQGATAFAETTLTVNAAPLQAVTSLTLINADTDQDIATLTNGYVINLAQTATRNLSIRANTNPATVGSVTFNLNGSIVRTENIGPYTINGDLVSGGTVDYYAWTPPLGNHTLVCTPFTAFGGTGTAGQALSISFSVIDRANQPPSVSAGANRSLTLPANNITLNGTATDTDGSIASLAWTQRSGPNTATLSGASTPNLAASNLVAGSYVFRLTATDNQGATAFAETTLTVAFPVGQSVQSFTLVNADTDQDIATLANGQSINLAQTGTRLNIRANTNPGIVGSVVFTLNGSQFSIESGAPYALAANSGTDYLPWTPPLGNHTLTATPFTSAGGTGTAGTPLTISFSVTNVVATNAIPNTGGGLSIKIKDEQSPTQEALVLPKVLSPNADGVNDTWEIENFAALGGAVQLTVYNRWGQVVYATHDYQNTWDGTANNGQPLPEATYHYVLQATGRTLTGAVNLLR